MAYVIQCKVMLEGNNLLTANDFDSKTILKEGFIHRLSLKNV